MQASSSNLSYRPPALIRLINKTGIEVSLNKDDLIKSARRETGLNDLGIDFRDDALEILLKSASDEAEFSTFGRFIFKTRLKAILNNKLRAEQHFKNNPEILKQELIKPVFITGLQRTGTTFLQRILSAHPDAQSLKSWEALNPAPLLNAEKDRSWRIGQAQLAERALRFISPKFFAIHPVEHMAPEEEVMLMDPTFMGPVSEATIYAPTYLDWLSKQDHTPVYEYVLKLLKLIQWKSNKKFWVLKSPHHLQHLPIINKVFKKPKIVFNHRAPSQTIASFSSMMYYGRLIFSNNVKPAQIGRQWLDTVSEMMQKAMLTRKSEKYDVLDIGYAELLKNPTNQLHLISDFADLNWDINVKFEIEKALLKNKKDRFGNHKYALEDFGLDKAEVESKFADYYSTYKAYIN